MKPFIRRFLSASASLMMFASAAVSFPKTNASAANTYWKFDFGGGGTASGYLQASDLNGDLKSDAADMQLLSGYLTGNEAGFADPKYAAAEQLFESGVHEDKNEGFRCSDYINLDNNTDSSLTFKVNLQRHQEFRYSPIKRSEIITSRSPGRSSGAAV